MAVTRFYQPSQAQYVSQFVPTELPVDLMVRSLGAKQQQADLAMAKSVELGNWSQRALENHDTEYVKAIKDELEAFTAKSSSVDRTSPEYQREYLQLVNKIKKDEGLQAVAASVAKDDKFWARHDELIKKGDNAHAKELEAQYLHDRAIYTAVGGEGFKGKVQLSDPNTLEGRKHQEDAIKFFTPIKDSGSEFAKSLSSGISYKNGFDGITDTRVKSEASRLYESWMQTDAGKQDWQRELQDLGYVNSTFNALDDKTKKQVVQKVAQSTQQNFLDVGLTVVHGKSTTGLAEARNLDRGERKKQEENQSALLVSTNDVKVVKQGNADRLTLIGNLTKSMDAINAKLYKDKEYTYTDASGNPITTKGENTLTDADRNNLIAQRNAMYHQRHQLKLDSAEAISEVASKVFSGKDSDKANLTINNLSKAQAELISKISDPNIKRLLAEQLSTSSTLKDYVFNTNDLSRSIDQYNGQEAEGVGYDAKGNILRVIGADNVQENRVASFADQSILRELKSLETRKKNYAKPKTEEWNSTITKDLYNKNQGVIIQQTSVTPARTDINSAIAKMSNEITNNKEAFEFQFADGTHFDVNTFNNGINSFKASSITQGNVSGGDNIGVHGTVTFNVKHTDPKTGKISYTTKTLPTVAIAKNKQNINNNAFAEEYNKAAYTFEQQANSAQDASSRNYYSQQAKVATDARNNLINNKVLGQLQNFESNTSGKVLPLTIYTHHNDGTGGYMTYQVKKITDSNGLQDVNISGYELIGDPYRKEPFNTIEELSNYLKTTSGTN